MRIADLTSGAAKLNKSVKTLQEAWVDVADHWDDENSRSFVENHLEPIGPQIKMALDALNRVADVVARAERECDTW